MILHDSREYRIESVASTPKPIALDRKEKSGGTVCLVNVGWYDCYEHALDAMTQDRKRELKGRQQCDTTT